MQHGPLIPESVDQARRLSRRRLGVVALVAVGVGAGGLLWKLNMGEPDPSSRPLKPPVEEESAAGGLPPASSDLHLPSSYGQVSLMPPPSEAPPAAGRATPPPGGPSPSAASRPPATSEPRPPQAPAGLPPPQAPPSGGQVPPQGRTVAATAPKKELRKPRRWFGEGQAEQGDVMKPPLAVEGQDKEKQESKLFPKAVWEKPLRPERVLYADQMIQGQLMQDVNSDIPGTQRIKVVQDVQDRWGLGYVLVRKDSVFLAKQTSKTSYGEVLIPMDVYMGIFPDGSAMAWSEASVGTAGGANGLPGNVNSHYPKVIAGAVLQALVNIGVRAPFGSPSANQYQPNLTQEYSRDVAQSLGQSSQEILRRELAVRPTITQDQGYPVTIQFQRNVSFQTDPVLVSK